MADTPIELTTAERITLAQLTNHPGFDVLVKLIETECEEATKAVIKLDPEKAGSNYAQILESRQLTARAINGFAKRLLRNIEYSNKLAVIELQKENAVEEDADTPLDRFNFPDLIKKAGGE